MSHYSLKPLSDVVVSFHVMRGDRQIGHIRREDVHAESLHLGERRYWLLHEQSATGATLLARWVGRFRLDRTYLLRDGDAELARARRHWTALGRRDWLEYRASGDPQPIRIESEGMMAGDIRLFRGEAAVGTIAIGGTWRDHISLQLDGFEPAPAALLMLAVLRAWGNDPHVRHY